MPRLAAVTKAALPVKPRSMAYPPKQPTGSDVALRKLDSDDVEGRADKLVCVDNDVWIGREVQVGLLGIHAVILGQPVHHANEGSVQCPIHAACIPRAVHLDEAAGSLDPKHAGDPLLLDHVAADSGVHGALVSNSCVLAVALSCVAVAEEKQPAVVVSVEHDAVALAHVFAVDVAAPGSLSDERIVNPSLRGCHDRPQERTKGVSHLSCDYKAAAPIRCSAAGSGLVPGDPRIEPLQLGEVMTLGEVAEGGEEPSPARVGGDHFLDFHHHQVTVLRALDVDRTSHWVHRPGGCAQDVQMLRRR